jgi:hypothetical protein
MSPLLPILGHPGRLADLVADAVVMLIRAAADRESPHELEPVRVIGVNGQPRMARRFPAEWARRLAHAAESGAFKRRDVADIVETILTTPEPVVSRSEIDSATAAQSEALSRRPA